MGKLLREIAIPTLIVFVFIVVGAGLGLSLTACDAFKLEPGPSASTPIQVESTAPVDLTLIQDLAALKAVIEANLQAQATIDAKIAEWNKTVNNSSDYWLNRGIVAGLFGFCIWFARSQGYVVQRAKRLQEASTNGSN